MQSVINFTTALAAFISVLALYLVLRRQRTIRNIVGPPSPSWIFGHIAQLVLSPRYGDYEHKWLKLYGAVYRLKGCFGQDRLMVSDPLAMQYILNSSHFYRSPIRDTLAYSLFGRGSLITARGMFCSDPGGCADANIGLTGEEHRRLRAALSVGFSTAAVRGYQPVFQKVAEMLSGQLEQSTAEATNVCPLLSTATLGAISEAMLGRSLQDLGQDFVENNIKIVELSASQSKAQILADAIGANFPAWFWRAVMYLPTKSFKVIRKERYLADRIGHQIVQEKVEAARQGLDINNDFFGLLVTDTLEKTKKELSEEDIRSQTGIILVAGQETTANTMAFGLLELARHPDFQDKLRAEIYSNPRTGIKDVGYDNMPLLNAFIKETLRLYPAQPLSDRIALQDTVIPLGDSITTSTGQQITQIPVQKGQLVTLAIGSYQRLESRWGKDAHEFNPFRWLGGASYQGEALGPYANLSVNQFISRLSFFGGPRTCLGWRFAILEMQVIFCELVGKFSFSEQVNEAVRPRYINNIMPAVASGERAMPLCITRVL
ncbi:cytochrome P450 [Mycena latifolia]|nr:cytochrome P450 [Mycena latifolia]